MHSIRRILTLLLLAATASVSAQTGPMLTPSAFIEPPGHLKFDFFGQAMAKEPNYLTYAEKGVLEPRTRIDGPVIRLSYIPSERAEFTAEFITQTFAINDPRYGTVSDFGDATLRGKLGLAKGNDDGSPAVAAQFEVTLPNTSFGNGLGPNTIRLATTLLVGYRKGKLALNGNAGLAISDEPLRAHEQRDFLSLSGSVVYQASNSVDVFVDAGGFFGDGAPGAIAKSEARAGLQHHLQMFGRSTNLFLAARRGLVDFQGTWGAVAGLTTVIRPGRP